MYIKKILPLCSLAVASSLFAGGSDNMLYKTKDFLQSHDSQYVVGGSLGYSYFAKKDLDISYDRTVDNGEDGIDIDKRYKNPTIGLLFGINSATDSFRYISSVFYGVKAVYFSGTSKGEMVPLQDEDFKCSDTKAKLPLKNLNVLLNGKAYSSFEKRGIRPFVEAGVGANFYELGFKVTGDPEQFDTKLKDNDKVIFAYNLGAGLTKEFNNDWHGSIAYNYYGSKDLETKKTAKSGLNLAKAVKPEYRNSNISIEVQKRFPV